MRYSVANLVMPLGLMVIGVTGGLLLMPYSETGGAPGGVVIGMLIILGTLALGVWVARRKTRQI